MSKIWKKKKNKAGQRYIEKPVVLEVPDKESGTVAFSNISDDGFWVFDIANYLPENMKKFTSEEDEQEVYYIGAWDFQLKSSTDSRIAYYGLGADTPTFGVSYEVYFEGKRMGEIELVPVFYSDELSEEHYKNNTRELDIYLEIDNAASIEYEKLIGLLNCLYDSFARFSDNRQQRMANATYINRSMQKVLWNNQLDKDNDTPLEFSNRVTLPMERLLWLAKKYAPPKFRTV